MLLSLNIENIAVIEKASVEFQDGFNVLTGETGAGKSLLIDSLSMVLGMRTSKDIVRSGASFASVSALFTPSPDLTDLGVEPEEDGSVLLYRKLDRDGRNICKINSSPVTLSTLRSAGERLVSIHGQHDGVLLLKPSSHLSLLDEFAADSAALKEYQGAYRAYKDAQKALTDSSMSESLREQQKDILSFRIAELEKADIQKDEDTALIQRRDVLRSFSTIHAALEGAYEALASDGGAKDALYSSMKQLEIASLKDSSYNSLSERITDLYYNAEDAASEINSLLSGMVFSPEELDDIENRLDTITRLKKKYNSDTDGLLQSLAEWKTEYENLLSYEENSEKLKKDAEEKKRIMIENGEKLEKIRSESAEKLSALVMDELSFLDMPRSRFDVSFTEREPDTNGLRTPEFMLSSNPSEPLRPLSKIASGGEMSRIMLAFRSALTGGDNVGTLLFDEIDSGVSGRAALKIASKISALSKSRQIICITHLPQMAASAACHLLVSKDTNADSFKTTVTLLDREGRIKELSRLISGDSENEAAKEAAKDLLERLS